MPGVIRRFLDKVFVRNAAGATINPSTEEKQDATIARIGEVSASPTANTLLARLKQIHEAVDGLEFSVDSLVIESGDINLNTDDLEEKLDTINTTLGTPRQEDGHGSSEATPSWVRESVKRLEIPGLTFSVTLGALASHTTSWVDVSGTNWLDIHAKLGAASAVRATIEFTDAADPNVTPPGADDVDRPITTTLAGASLGGITKPSFGIPAQMQWARITLTDLTGGQDIDVSVFDHDHPPESAQVPIATPLTDDFRAIIAKTIGHGKRVDGSYANVPISEHSRDTNNEQVVPLTNGPATAFTTDFTTDVFTSVAHGLVDGNVVFFTNSGGVLPAPLVADTAYYVRDKTTDTFKVATTATGSAVDLTDDGTGTHTFKKAGEFIGTYQRLSDYEHTEYLYASLTPITSIQRIYSGDGVRELDRTVTDGVLNSTTTVTSASAAFTQYDKGSVISGTGIPAGARIVTVSSATTVIISAAATVTASGVTLTLANDFSPGTLAQRVISGYNTVYDVTEGRHLAPFYKLKIINGPTDQTVFPGFIAIGWLMKNAYQGSFTFLDSALTNLSKSLLVRSASPQFKSTGNSSTRTATHGATEFVGTWEQTRAIGTLRELIVLASTEPTGLGGTFTFQFSDDVTTPPTDGSTATISETRIIEDFSTVRDFDLLNAGTWFRIKFTPDRALVGAEKIFITTTYNTAYPGPFVRLANQELEESNAAMSDTFAYLKAFHPTTNKSVNIRAVGVEDIITAGLNALLTKSVISGQQPDGDFENSRLSGSVPGSTTATPLGADGVFSGTAFDATGFLGISIILKADQVSATDGLKIQFSNDGFATISREQKYTYGAADVGEGRLYAVAANQGEEFRIRYTNGPTPQGSFDLRTELTTQNIQTEVGPVETPISGSSSAQVARSVIFGKATSTTPAAATPGQYINALMDLFGRLQVTQGSDFARLLARSVENTDELKLDAEPTTTQTDTVTDGETTITSTTISSPGGQFKAWHRGASITGTGIPAGAWITEVTSATSAKISVAATLTNTGLTFTLSIVATYLGKTVYGTFDGSATHDVVLITSSPTRNPMSIMYAQGKQWNQRGLGWT